jgi:hypothetical protein
LRLFINLESIIFKFFLFFINKTMKRAFLCGINYIGTSSALNGCINDMININNFLVKNCGYDSKNIRIMTDDPNSTTKPTRANIEAGINWLASNCAAGDTLVFYYSGHGSHIRDTNSDESDGRDSVLVPLDYETKGVITDDWLFLNLASRLPAGVTLWAFTDCCHSGTMLDLQFNLQSNSVYRLGKPRAGLKYNTAEWTNQYGMSTERSRVTAADVYLFSGCLDPQTSADATIRNQAQGAFTACFLEFVQNNMTKNPDGTVRYNSGTRRIGEMLKEINCRLVINNFEQRPQLSMGKIQDMNRPFNI